MAKNINGTDEFKKIIGKYQKNLTNKKMNKLDAYTKTRLLLNDQNIEIKRKTDMEQDASEYDEVFYNNVAYKKIYKNIKYPDENKIKELPVFSDEDGYKNKIKFNTIIIHDCKEDINDESIQLEDIPQEEFNRKRPSVIKVTKYDKLFSPKKVNNNSLIIKDDDILPMIYETKNKNKNNFKNRHLKFTTTITDKENISDMKKYLINKVEKSIEYSTTKKNFRSLSQNSIFTNNNSTINSNYSNNKRMLKIEDHYDIKIENILNDNKTKHLLNKINKQIVTDDVMKQISNVQKKLIEKSKLNMKKFTNYRGDSEELRRRYHYIMNNNFI